MHSENTKKSLATPSTYIPPNKRQPSKNATAYPGTEKKEPRKEHCQEQLAYPAAYPTLSETMKNSPMRTTTTISFSSAAAKKQETPAEPIKSNLTPGWVYMRKHQGAIQYKYGAPVARPDYSEEEDRYISRMLYKFRLERQQYERDNDVEHLGDLSEYYGEPTLAEIMEEYERHEELNEEEYNSDGKYNSDGSDTGF